MKLEFVVFNYIFRQLDQLVSDPKGLDDLKIGAQGDQYAQKLLHVMELADVFIARLLGDYEILERQHRQLVGYLDRGGIGHLHLHERAFRLYRCARHAV